MVLASCCPPALKPERLRLLNHNHFFAAPDVRGTNFETLVAAFAQNLPDLHFAKFDRERTDEKFSWRTDFASGNGLSMWRAQCSAGHSIDVRGKEDEKFFVVFPIEGAFEVGNGQKSTTATPGTALMFAAEMTPLTKLRMHSTGTHRRVTLKFDTTLATKVVAATYEGATLRGLDLHGLLDLSTPPGQTFCLTAQTIVAGVYGGILDRSPTAAALMTEAALRLLFENVPHRFNDRSSPKLLEATPRNIRAAIDFMHANLHQPLTVTEIAEAAGVSVRSLQAGFQQFQDTTPIAYLRRLRLEAVHTELSLAENRLPVGEVALKWGFTQMGRFAAQYLAAYGIHPSVTARSARSASR